MNDIGAEPVSELYSRAILRLASDIGHIGHLDAPHGAANTVSRLCGSRVSVELRLKDGRVSEFAHQVQACALGQAAASVMAREILGSTPEELRALRETMRAMLKEGGPPPSGKWSDLAMLESVRSYPARHGSVMLTFDAVAAALDQAEAAAGAS